MSVLQLFVILIVIGVVLWLINNYLPMDAKIKKILNVVAVVLTILWLLSVFGVFGTQWDLPMGNWHMKNLHVK